MERINPLYHHYLLLETSRSALSLGEKERADLKKEFIRALKTSPLAIFSYSVKGFRSNASLLLWLSGDSLSEIQVCVNELTGGKFRSLVKIREVYFGKTGSTQYKKGGLPSREIKVSAPRRKYLIVYPFTKTTEWYLLPFNKRKIMMTEHIKIGMRYSAVDQLLLYCFGMNSHEFVVSYETDKIDEFQDLVMELRGARGRRYTANDTPVTLGIYLSHEEVVRYI